MSWGWGDAGVEAVDRYQKIRFGHIKFEESLTYSKKLHESNAYETGLN